MGASDPVEHIPPEARVEGDATPGMQREQALATEMLWAGVARTEPGMLSGWHHHGESESVIYVVAGRFRIESGPGGAVAVEGHAGDFLRVPPGAIHRESNPGEDTSEVVVVRNGHGPAVFNVDGPAER